ncbi:MAG TPA: hypothetical protein VGZ90_10680 [Puia sp.]|jgi:hypothetical protein|nr:hypothetical protein [Puia sp.]
MSISKIDIELFKLLSKLNLSQKEALITFIKHLLNAKENMDRQFIDEYNLELNNAKENIRKGEYISLEDLEREMELW